VKVVDQTSIRLAGVTVSAGWLVVLVSGVTGAVDETVQSAGRTLYPFYMDPCRVKLLQVYTGSMNYTVAMPDCRVVVYLQVNPPDKPLRSSLLFAAIGQNPAGNFLKTALTRYS